MMMMMSRRNSLSISGSTTTTSPYYYYYLVVLLLFSFPSPVVSDFLYDPNCGIVAVSQAFWVGIFGFKDCKFFEVMDVIRIILWVCIVFGMILFKIDENNDASLLEKVCFGIFAIVYITFIEFFTIASILVGMIVTLWCVCRQ